MTKPNSPRYKVTYATGEKLDVLNEITIEADVVDVSGSVFSLNRRIKTSTNMEPINFEPPEGDEPIPVQPTAIYEIVFLMPFGRIVHVQKLSPAGVN